MLVKRYKENPQHFTVQYERKTPTQISQDVEQNIIKKLSIEKEIPLKSYDYIYIKDRLGNTYHQRVSLSTIIGRTKKHGFYLKKLKKTLHDREILTHYAGELIQHDDLWAPAAQEKCLPAVGRVPHHLPG